MNVCRVLLIIFMFAGCGQVTDSIKSVVTADTTKDSPAGSEEQGSLVNTQMLTDLFKAQPQIENKVFVCVQNYGRMFPEDNENILYLNVNVQLSPSMAQKHLGPLHIDVINPGQKDVAKWARYETKLKVYVNSKAVHEGEPLVQPFTDWRFQPYTCPASAPASNKVSTDVFIRNLDGSLRDKDLDIEVMLVHKDGREVGLVDDIFHYTKDMITSQASCSVYENEAEVNNLKKGLEKVVHLTEEDF